MELMKEDEGLDELDERRKCRVKEDRESENEYIM